MYIFTYYINYFAEKKLVKRDNFVQFILSREAENVCIVVKIEISFWSAVQVKTLFKSRILRRKVSEIGK